MAIPTTTTEAASVATPAAAVRLESVVKRYGDVVAVDGIDLEVRDGEFFSMLGPSGSGKTTTLRMIAGFETPTAGRVVLHGADVTNTPPFDRDVNTVFQDYALFPHMSVGDNVAYGLMVRKVPKPERIARVTDALRMVRLDGYEARKPSQLSGGQRQRVALARSLVNRPRVLLLDEPLGALDLKLREEMQIELKAIQQQVGITFIYVTHDQEEALTMSDRLAVFNAGRIEQVGAPADVYERPGDPVRRRASSARQTCSPARSRRRSSGRPGTFTVRPEKIHIADPDADGRGRREHGPRADPGRRLSRTRHALHRHARRGDRPRGHSTESRDDLDRGARIAGPGCPAGVEATARSPRRRRGLIEADRRRRIRMRTRSLVGLIAGVAILAGACSGGGASTAPSAAATTAPTTAASQPAASAGSAAPSTAAATPGPSLPTAEELGSTQGQTINVLAWPGYVENGSTDQAVDWVTDFQKTSGCTVKPTIFGTSDEAYTLFSTNPEQFDLVSASGDASLRLVRGGFVQPFNLALSKSYPDIFPALKDKPYNTVDGVSYGIPHGRGSNLLMWRTDQVTPPPTKWAQMFDPASGYKVSIYDAPIYIADAAVLLMATKPELGIKNPYALDETQFAAALELLKQQKPAITQRWTDYTQADGGLPDRARPMSGRRGRSSRTC